MQLMHQRGVLNSGKAIDYAAGLSHSEYRGLKLVGHGGADAGFRSYAVRVPEHNLGVVVLSNVRSFNSGGVARQVVEIVLADQVDPEKKDHSKVPSESVDVEPEVLDRYIGVFRMDNGMMVKFKRRGQRLVSQVEQLVPAVLIAKSDTEFFEKEIGARVVFEAAGEDPVEKFTAYLEGQTLHGARFEEDQSKQLTDYVGTYYSPELETVYVVELQEDQLIARHQRHPDVRLKVVGKDEFAGSEGFLRSVTFDREGDTVSGFRVTSLRVRNLRFVRRSADD